MTISVNPDELIHPSDVYRLARHYRFQWEEAQQCYVLLFPEGMIKLNGGAGEVIKRIDGNKTVSDVVQELKTSFPEVPDLESDIIAMINLAVEKAWIDKVNA